MARKQKIAKAFEWQPFSKKQLKIMTWWTSESPVRDADGIIADGAVRSGKTVSMTASFILWAMSSFSERDFAMCGKTVGSLRRNVIGSFRRMLTAYGMTYEERRTDNFITVTWKGVTNTFYLFGGKDEASQDLIQGMTLAGILFDEVALMPQSFVAQGEARCSVDGSKLWYNCNPRGPTHFFKKEYVDRAKEKHLLYLHFTMDDNLTLSEPIKERYRRQFTGVFYDRNILGLWVTAEGKIYRSFTKDNIIPASEWYAVDGNGRYSHPLRASVMTVTMGVDFGGNGSAHAFNLTGFTRSFRQIITLKERRITQELNPSELDREFIDFLKNCKAEYPLLTEIFCDSAEQVLIRGLQRAAALERIPVAIKNARKGEIIDRIRFYAAMQDQHRYFVISDCINTVDAFTDAVWDDKHPDERLDDGSTNIDSLDAQEYSSEKYMTVMLDMKKAGD